MLYEEQLAVEALAVGAITVGTSSLIERMFPRLRPPFRLFLTGMVIHLGFEYLGTNEWYLHNGASYKKWRQKNPEEKSCPTIRESECQYTHWQEQEYSCLEYT